MKKIFALSIFAIFLAASFMGLAQGQPEIKADVSEHLILKDAGTLPDSWFYGFKRFGEGVQEFFTFDLLEKAKLKYDIAEIRLMEAEVMAREGKQDLADTSLKDYEIRLAEIEKNKKDISSSGRDVSSLSKIADDSAYKHILVLQKVHEKVPETAKPEIERVIEDSLERHSSLMGTDDDARKVDFNILLGGGKVLDKKVSSSFAEKVLEKETEVEKEFEREVELEDKEGLKKELAGISGRFEDNAKREIVAQKEKIIRLESKDINESVLDEAKSRVDDAEKKFREGKFEDSLDSALSGSRLARIAEKIDMEEFEKVELLSKKLDVDRNSAELEIEDVHDRMVSLERSVAGAAGGETKVRADVFGNNSEIKIEARFQTGNTDRNAIAQEILNKLKMSKDDVANFLEIRFELQDLRERLDAEARVRDNNAEARVEFRFPLGVSDRAKIVDGIASKVSSLTLNDIQKVLEFEDRREGREGENREDRINEDRMDRLDDEFEVRAEIAGNRAEVKIERRFSTADIEKDKLVSDIIRKFELGRQDADRLLRIENRPQERLEERLDVEAKVEGGVAEVKAERRFILDNTDRDSILNAVVEKSRLDSGQIERALEFEDENRRVVGNEFEKEIEVEIEGNQAKVKAKIDGRETNFTLGTADVNQIVSQVSARTGLSVDDVGKLARFKKEIEIEREAEQRGQEPEAERGGVGEIRGRAAEGEIEKEAEIERELERAREHLIEAEDAFDDSRHGEAFGHAAIASRIVDDAKKIEVELENIRREDRRENRGQEPEAERGGVGEIRGRSAEGEIEQRGQEPEAERGGAGEIRGREAEGEIEPESGRSSSGGSSGSSSGSSSGGSGSSGSSGSSSGGSSDD